MDLKNLMARDIVGDLSKGRFNRQQTEEMLMKLCKEVGTEIERTVFEYCALMFLQNLHYDFGFGKKRLERFISHFSEMALAFDAGAYDMQDMRDALKDDVGIEVEIEWNSKERSSQTDAQK